MYQKLRKKTQGFTIIEVLIVLAIAGLIMLIVFLAVPALQRNSRNNGRRSDVSRIGAAIDDFVANRNGRLPDGAIEFIGVLNGVGNVSQYDITFDPTAESVAASATGNQGTLTSTPNIPRLRYVAGAVCDPSGNGETDAGSQRQAAIQYQLETNSSGTHTNVCLDV